jgi:hypothetical protein
MRRHARCRDTRRAGRRRGQRSVPSRYPSRRPHPPMLPPPLIVEDADNRRPGLPCHSQEVDDAREVDTVERARRLIEQQQVGVCDQGAGNVDALLLAAGKECGVCIIQVRRQREPSEHLRRPCECVLMGYVAFDQWARDDLNGGDARRCLEKLRDVANCPLSQREDRMILRAGEVDLAPISHEMERARCGQVGAIDALQQRGFAAAARPDNRRHLAARRRKRHIVERGHPLSIEHMQRERLAQSLNAQMHRGRLGGHPLPLSRSSIHRTDEQLRIRVLRVFENLVGQPASTTRP